MSKLHEEQIKERIKKQEKMHCVQVACSLYTPGEIDAEYLISEANIIYEFINSKKESSVVTTKEELVKAMHSYNLDFFSRKDEYEEIDASLECAEEQVVELLKHLQEVKEDVRQ